MGTAILNQLLQMNLIGIYGILLAFAVRLVLRKAGSRYCYALWIIVFLNLALPTVLTGSFSLIPKQLYQVELSQDDESAYDVNAGDDLTYSGLNAGQNASGYYSTTVEYYDLRNGAVDEVVDITSDAAVDTASDMTGVFGTAGIAGMLESAWKLVAGVFGGEEMLARCLLTVWITVMVILFMLEGLQYQKTRRRLKALRCTATDEENRAVTLEGLETPLLFGFVQPTICLPEHLKEEERAYILRHELYHRRRRDYIVKAVVLSISIVYWYNPLVWAAFHCFGVDMELSCDEAVLLQSDTDIRKAYAGSLLKYGALQNHYVLTSLTFGEPGLRARVKHVLQFKKRGVIITAVAVLAVILLAVGLLVRPSAQEEDGEVLSAAEETRILTQNDDAQEEPAAEQEAALDDAGQTAPSGNTEAAEEQTLDLLTIRTLTDTDDEAEQVQKAALEQALAKADGEALTMEMLLKLVSGGYSALTEFDYFNCVNAVLEHDGGAGAVQIANYWYTFALEYESVAYTFRARYYKSDNTLDMLYLTDDAGAEDNFALYYTKEGSSDYIAAAEDFVAYLQETADKSNRTQETVFTSVALPDGYTLGAWDTTIFYSSDSGATMSGGVLIEPVAYALQEGYEKYALVADWQYYSGFFAVIDEGFWSWEGDTLVPGTFPRESHMSSELVEMLDGTAKTAYLLEVGYDMYTAAGQAALEEGGVSLDRIDTVSEYWYIVFVDDGAGTTTGYCLGLAQNQFTKEEAVAIAQSVVFAE